MVRGQPTENPKSDPGPISEGRPTSFTSQLTSLHLSAGKKRKAVPPTGSLKPTGCHASLLSFQLFCLCAPIPDLPSGTSELPEAAQVLGAEPDSPPTS